MTAIMHRFDMPSVLSRQAFMQADRRCVVLHTPRPFTKADLLAASQGKAEIAYRLYLACDASTTPQVVLCRDLFEMPDKRQFPELASDSESLSFAR